ncbi:MAG: dihydropteroate synthase, partial [Candidatus Sumerlaea chitinivorans]|nr:dihydropteroate synthase [Candidatus Sumerlaea chitinivorans]
MTDQFPWRVRGKLVLPADHTLVMGILNVTPDSFSDGGRYLDPQSALAAATQMVEAGVDILDIGGESTRPTR